MTKTLVVFYSRTGVTRAAAERVANALGADLEEIVDHQHRRGLLGYLRCGYQAYFGLTPRIDPPRFDPRDYDVVVIATPIWNASLASPMRSYLEAHRGKLRRIALLITCGSIGVDRVVHQIEEVTQRQASCHVALTNADREEGEDHRKIQKFVHTLQYQLAAYEAPTAEVSLPSSPSFA